MDAEEEGGYLVKLTTNVGQPSEDIKLLYFGIRSAVTGLAAPALNETHEDNSPGNDPSEGWWGKMFGWTQWVEQYIQQDIAVPPETGVYYVNFDEGVDDITNTGSIQLPWKTIEYACGQVTTADLAEYNTPVMFRVAPGTYDHSGGGALDMPLRNFVAFEGEHVNIIGDINFHQDPSQPWGQDSLVAGLYFGTPTAPTFVIDGDIHCQCVAPDLFKPGYRALAFDKVVFQGNIHNASAGASVATKGTGELYLGSLHAQFATGSYIFGEAEPTGDENDYNAVRVRAWDTYFAQRFVGFIAFENMQDCFLDGSIRYDRDHNDDPYVGRIEGSSAASLLSTPGNFFNCTQKMKFAYFGDDGSLVGTPHKVSMDAVSFNSFQKLDADFKFDNFSPPGDPRFPVDLADYTQPQERVYYVNDFTGKDTPFAGTLERPFQTLAYAFQQIGDATDWATFNTEWVINMAPGSYNDTLTVPKRRVIRVLGDGYVIGGHIQWDYDLALWEANDPNVWPNTLTFQASGPHGTASISKSFGAKNDTPASGGGIQRLLYLGDILWNASSLVNEPSGDADENNNTGALNVIAHKTNFTSGEIGGTYETDPGANDALNTVFLAFFECQVFSNIYGCVGFGGCFDSFFYGNISYDRDPATGFGGYGGHIGGRQFLQGNAFQNCWFNTVGNAIPPITEMIFGYDPGKSFDAPEPIYLDEYSFNSMWKNNAALIPTFANMENEGGYRGTDSAISENVIWVTSTGFPLSNALNFLDAYARAKSRKPGGEDLSATNRMTVMVPPGDYLFPPRDPGIDDIGWLADAEFVDVIGMGGDARRNNALTPTGPDPEKMMHPGVRFTHNAAIPGWVAAFRVDDAHIQGIRFDQTNDGLEAAAFDALTPLRGKRFRMIGCSFTVLGAAAPHRDSAVVGSADYDAYFEQCHFDAGFYLGTSFKGKCVRCTTGAYGFNNVSAVPEAVFEDCHAGENSFGGDVGGVFAGIATRCLAFANSFGAELFSGQATDCKLMTGNGFGAGGTTAPVGQAIMQGCQALNLENGLPFKGKMFDCLIQCSHATEAVLRVHNAADPPIFKRNVFVTKGTPDYVIDSWDGNPKNMRMTHCEIDKGALGYINALVTNQIGNGYNVTDPDVKIA
jgi:hypothetical protein